MSIENAGKSLTPSSITQMFINENCTHESGPAWQAGAAHTCMALLDTLQCFSKNARTRVMMTFFYHAKMVEFGTTLDHPGKGMEGADQEQKERKTNPINLKG